MIVHLADWEFRVDIQATVEYTMKCSTDHCLCAYCRNYYESVDTAYPYLREFLDRFGILLEGPCEVMPLEPAVVLACYRVTGKILRKGSARMHADGVPVHFETADDDTFFLWAGEMVLPWTQEEPMEDVVSPANEPEFLERMARKWAQLQESESILS